MRVAVVIGALAVLALASAVPAATAPGARTSLVITYVEDSARPTTAIRWTLRCDPPRGTHPRRSRVCRELARVGWRAFSPVPPGTACAELFGGPQVALIRGRVGGHAVWARLSRADGCQIERWSKVPSLLPAGGPT